MDKQINSSTKNLDYSLKQQQSSFVVDLPVEQPAYTESSSKSFSNDSQRLQLKQSFSYILGQLEKSLDKSFQKKNPPFLIDASQISQIHKKTQTSISSDFDFSLLNLSPQQISTRKQQLNEYAGNIMTMVDGMRQRQAYFKEQNEKLRSNLGQVDVSFSVKESHPQPLTLSKKQLLEKCIQDRKQYKELKKQYKTLREKFGNINKI